LDWDFSQLTKQTFYCWQRQSASISN